MTGPVAREPDARVSPHHGGERRQLRLRAFANPRWYGFYVLIVLIAVFSALKTDTFFTVDNLHAIVGNQAVPIILAIALVVPLVAGQFDLSVASNLTLSMIVCTGMFQTFEAPLVVAVAAGVGVGASIGVINGIAVAGFGINSLVVTLATGSIATGIAQWWTNGTVFTQNIPASFESLGQDRALGLPLPVICMIVIGVAVWWALERMPVGRYLYALGDNPEAARLTGLRTAALTMGAFVGGGALAGVAGVLQAAKLGAGNPTLGASLLLPAFAAAFLGATIFRLGHYNVLGTIVAMFVVAVGIAGLQQLGVPFYVGPIFTGVVLLGAVTLTKLEGTGASTVAGPSQRD